MRAGRCGFRCPAKVSGPTNGVSAYRPAIEGDLPTLIDGACASFNSIDRVHDLLPRKMARVVTVSRHGHRAAWRSPSPHCFPGKKGVPFG
jgi:hypothetical protein